MAVFVANEVISPKTTSIKRGKKTFNFYDIKRNKEIGHKESFKTWREIQLSIDLFLFDDDSLACR